MPLAFKGSVMNPAPGRNPARFGEIPGFPVGSRWPGRRELCDDGVHAHLSNGIHGRGSIGAYSIVLSGGYEDDIDKGDKFTYTGQGGQARRDKGSGEKWSNAQIRNQEWTLGNLSLKTSCKTGTPVRVIRGSGLKSDYAPAVGYRYDGLYTVMKAEMKKGKSGFDICSFRFQRCPGQDPLPGLTATRPMRRERPHEFKSSAPPMPVASSSRIKSPVASTSNTGANSTIKRRALSFSSLFTNSSIRHPRPKHRSHPQPSVADYKSARPQAYQSSCKVEPSSPGPLNTPDSSDWEDSSSSGSQSPEPLRSVQAQNLQPSRNLYRYEGSIVGGQVGSGIVHDVPEPARDTDDSMLVDDRREAILPTGDSADTPAPATDTNMTDTGKVNAGPKQDEHGVPFFESFEEYMEWDRQERKKKSEAAKARSNAANSLAKRNAHVSSRERGEDHDMDALMTKDIGVRKPVPLISQQRDRVIPQAEVHDHHHDGASHPPSMSQRATESTFTGSVMQNPTIPGNQRYNDEAIESGQITESGMVKPGGGERAHGYEDELEEGEITE